MSTSVRQTLDAAPVDLLACRWPIRLAVADRDGFPHIVSLWFQYRDGVLRCVTHESAWVVEQLRHRPRVGFEISTNTPPYFGVRGVGTVALKPLGDSPLLREMIGHYLGDTTSSLAQWLLSRRRREVIIELTPERASTWDYTERMSDSPERKDGSERKNSPELTNSPERKDGPERKNDRVAHE